MYVLKASLVMLLSVMLVSGWALFHSSAIAAQERRVDATETPTVVFPVPSAVTNNTKVRIGGSPTMNPINQALKRQFEEQFPGTAIELEGKLADTETALEALQNGEIDLAAMGRSLTPEEKAAGLREVPVSFDKIAILTGRSNSFNGSLTIQQLGQIFRGNITDWSELGRSPGRIEIIDRPANSETRQALERYGIIPADDPPPEESEAETDSAAIAENGEPPESAEGIGEATSAITSTPTARVKTLPTDETAAVVKALGRNGLGYAIANQVRNEQAVKWIKIAIIRTTLPGDALYPYSQVRGYAYRDKTNSRVESFLGFTSTEAGRAAIAAARKAEAAVAAKPPPEPAVVEEPVETPVAIAPVETPGTGFDLSQIPTWAWFLIPIFPIAIPIYLVWRQRQARARRVTRPASPRPPVPSRSPQTTTAVLETPETASGETDELDDWDDDITELPTAPTAPDEAETVLDVEFEETAASAEADTPVAEEIDEAGDRTPATYVAATDTSPSITIPVPPEADKPPIPSVESDVDEQSDAGLEDIAPEDLHASEPEIASAENAIPSTPLPVAPDLDNADASTAEVAPPDTPDISETEEVSTAESTPLPEPDMAAAEEGVDSEVVSPVAAPLEPTIPVEAKAAEDESGAQVDAEEQVEAPAYSEVVPAMNPPETVAPPAETDAVDSPTHSETPSASEEEQETTAVVKAATESLVLELPEGGILTTDWLQGAIAHHLDTKGQTVETATPDALYMALAASICRVLLNRRTPEDLLTADPSLRLVAELAAEYTPGPHLKNALVNLGALETTQQTLQAMGQDLDTVMAQEEESGLGRGGLGRLMVCYLDSLATQRLPAIGYGLRYEYGIFDQDIQDGWQVEVTDDWLLPGNPWEVERPDRSLTVQFGGYTEAYTDADGHYRVQWNAAQSVQGQCFDTPIPGYQTDTVSLLRLWRANTSDRLGKVLYPVNEAPDLRLRQQYFLASCTVQDLLRLHLLRETTLDTLPDHLALQLNDTDTLLAIAELMRLLVDEYGLEWDNAWDITNHTLSYTNHSLLPETLDDQWGIDLFAEDLPRHLEIIYEINQRFLDGVRSQYFVETEQIRRLSLVNDDEQQIRLTNLACIGTHAVNGVSPLHSQRLQDRLLWDFYALTPDRFLNESNGINIRRFLPVTNTPLSTLITQHIGPSWIEDANELARLEDLATEPEFCHQWHGVKLAAKEQLAVLLRDRLGETVDPHSLFDGQLTVIHEYKRQLLNLLHVITLYQQIKANPNQERPSRTVLFSGKASPDYDIAKRVIKLIHQVAATVNRDPDTSGRLKVVFLPDFTLKLAEQIYPALDLSEHLSQAGTEAGDTGNMMAALNGALLMTTPDGSNLELQEALGDEAVFQFGLTVAELEKQRKLGYYPQAIYSENPALQQAVDALTDGTFGETEAIAQPIVHSLLSDDPYGVLADYAAYVATQDEVDRRYGNPAAWTTHSIRAVARMGRFSSDRAIQNYNQDIWNAPPAAKRLRQRIKPPGG
ncbi:MAG: glycogen/starch/alpha-glucan family phosphorylase [Cyanobacteria bacterium J06638_22]